ncbi:MAG: imidazolonepropionase [Gemmatimonadota bacterium]
MNPVADLLITGASEVVTCLSSPDDPAGRLEGAVVAIGGETILSVGSEMEVAQATDCSAATRIDAEGGVVAPGFVDCHTHLVFGGSRSLEYAARLTHSVAEVRELGIPSGISATVAMTRAASASELVQSASVRLADMLRHGTTTAESKTGYGLTLDEELKLLEVNRSLDAGQPVDIVSTFMGAHDFPPEMSADRYVEYVIEDMIPAVAESGLASFNDVFLDDGYYSVAQARRILEAGAEAGLPAKVHTEQYSSLGGGDMAAEIGVVSADHLNYSSPATLEALARAGSVGVVMPLLDFAVAHPQPASARAVLDSGLTLALATDLCPGCYAVSMHLALQVACRTSGITVEEAILAATAGAAAALGLEDRGRLGPGMLADIQIWNVPKLEDVAYRIGHNATSRVIKRGKVAI